MTSKEAALIGKKGAVLDLSELASFEIDSGCRFMYRSNEHCFRAVVFPKLCGATLIIKKSSSG